MKTLQDAIRRTELAVADLKRVEANPKDECALVMAYGELDFALACARRLFAQLGFDPIEPRVEELSAAETRGDLQRLLATNAAANA